MEKKKGKVFDQLWNGGVFLRCPLFLERRAIDRPTVTGREAHLHYGWGLFTGCSRERSALGEKSEDSDQSE